MMKRYFILFYLLMIALGAYLLADTVNLFIGSHLEAAVEPPPKPFQKGSSRPTIDYQAIVEGNIFSAKLRGKHPAEAKGAPPPVAAAPLPPLNMTLIGTVVGEGELYAVIEDGKTHEQTLYHLGDRIGDASPGAQGQPGGKIIRIARNEVVILRQGQREVLTVPLGEETKPASIAPQPVQPAVPSAGSGVRQVAEGKWVLDRREVDSAVDNLPQLLTKARVIPNFTNGKPDGFKIFAIDASSLYAKIGLQNGDVIQRINGIEMRDPQNFMRVFQQLKDEPNITIDLVRNNQKETFGYEIR